MKLLIFALIAVSTALVSPKARAGDAVPEIQISHLPAGQILNVFYSNGRPAAISDDGSTPVIRKVYQIHGKLTIPSSGVITLSATNVPNITPFWVTDYVVLAISTTPAAIYINNSDGSVPTYPTSMKTPTQFTNLTNVRYIHLTDYADGASIPFDFSAPLK